MIIGLLSFAGMGVAHKMGDRWSADPLLIAIFTMFSAAGCSFLIAMFKNPAAFRTLPPPIFLALPFGVSAALGLWFFQKGLRFGHIASSWLLINLSSAIPTVLSIAVYREPLNARKALAFVLLVASLILLWWERRSTTITDGEL